MKKSLQLAALAGVFVLGGAGVSASNQTIGGTDTAEYQAPVEVNGSVLNADGTVAEGIISVSLPTAASFTVDSYGALTGGSLTVTNDSAVGIDVHVANFIETLPSAGINVHPQGTDLSAMTRDNVMLSLSGNASTVSLDPAFSYVAPGTLVSKIASASTDTLVLAGSAGQAEVDPANFVGSVDEVGTNEEFNLVFTIKKSAE